MPGGSGVSREELARRAGVGEERIDELTAAGVLAAEGDDAARPFEPADVNRVHLAESLLASGISLEDIRGAVTDGRLSFGFIGDLFPQPVDHVPGTTMGEFASSKGVSMELVRQVHARLGLAQPNEDDPIRTDEARYMPLAALALGAGMDDAALAHFSRVMGENLRRLADAQVHFFRTSVIDPMIAAGLPSLKAWELSAAMGREMRPLSLKAWELSAAMGREMRPLFGELLLWVYERHQETYILDNVIELMEEALRGEIAGGRSRARDQAIAFLDLSGFTRLTEERGGSR